MLLFVNACDTAEHQHTACIKLIHLCMHVHVLENLTHFSVTMQLKANVQNTEWLEEVAGQKVGCYLLDPPSYATVERRWKQFGKNGERTIVPQRFQCGNQASYWSTTEVVYVLEVVQQKAVTDSQGYNLVLFGNYGLLQMRKILEKHASLRKVEVTQMTWVQVCALLLCFDSACSLHSPEHHHLLCAILSFPHPHDTHMTWLHMFALLLFCSSFISCHYCSACRPHNHHRHDDCMPVSTVSFEFCNKTRHDQQSLFACRFDGSN